MKKGRAHARPFCLCAYSIFFNSAVFSTIVTSWVRISSSAAAPVSGAIPRQAARFRMTSNPAARNCKTVFFNAVVSSQAAADHCSDAMFTQILDRAGRKCVG